MIWYDLREEEFEGAIERSGGLCVIPLGCTEKHGQHLPVGTDYYEALTIVKKAAEIEDVVILPVEAWLGEVSPFHAISFFQTFGDTISLGMTVHLTHTLKF